MHETMNTQDKTWALGAEGGWRVRVTDVPPAPRSSDTIFLPPVFRIYEVKPLTPDAR